MVDKTPTKEVLEMQDWNPIGNIIPHTWFSLFRTEGKKRNQPDYLTMHILADICYWYRPSIVVNEETGEFQGYERKFKGEYLQKHTTHLAKQYGTDDRTARRALQKLEEMGIIERIFKNEEVNGRVFNDIQYIRLVPNKIKELSKSDPGGRICKTGGSELQGRGVGLIRPHTENTTKITNKEKDTPSVNTSGGTLSTEDIKEDPKERSRSQTTLGSKDTILLTDEEKELLGETDNVQPRQRKDEKVHLSLGGRRRTTQTAGKEGRTAAQVLGHQKENEIGCLDELVAKYSGVNLKLPKKAPKELVDFWRDAEILSGVKYPAPLSDAEAGMLKTLCKGYSNWAEVIGRVVIEWDQFTAFCLQDKVWENVIDPRPSVGFLVGKYGRSRIGPYLQSTEAKTDSILDDEDLLSRWNITT